MTLKYGLPLAFSTALLMTNPAVADTATTTTGTTMTTQTTQQQAAPLTGDAFLAANKTKPGVHTLPDGLQYKIITPGNGAKPTANDSVTVDYRGTLIDGTEFDSSYKRGQPATFPVNGVIQGWQEALQLMPVGSKWELYIPPTLAYGTVGAPPLIGPNQTLIFQVELKKIN
ncbi:MAG: FKBP-type peptidyl-prolyl cis-trans isomerase [Gammaproteobacteria bacterium]|nr:FKBP-type peptidyl-prolyl cis-trans isomerase [Gammaproteobacteria bacterium]